MIFDKDAIFVSTQAILPIPNPLGNCYIAASGSMYFGCKSQTTDLIATASIHLKGSANIEGNVISRYLSVGRCSGLNLRLFICDFVFFGILFT
jgi:hypothetical protein